MAPPHQIQAQQLQEMQDAYNQQMMNNLYMQQAHGVHPPMNHMQMHGMPQLNYCDNYSNPAYIGAIQNAVHDIIHGTSVNNEVQWLQRLYIRLMKREAEMKKNKNQNIQKTQ